MTFVFTSIIAAVLFFLEVSVLPHFWFYLAGPFLFLPFLSIISLRDRTIFPIILAAALGLVSDSVSGNVIPVFLIAYLAVTLISKVFMSKFTSYGEIRANIINITIGMFIIYGTDLVLTMGNIKGLQWLLPILINMSVTYLLLIIYIIAGQKYFNWLEKETEERFR